MSVPKMISCGDAPVIIMLSVSVPTPVPPSIKPVICAISTSVNSSTPVPPTRLVIPANDIFDTVASVSIIVPLPVPVISQVLIAASFTCNVLVPKPPLIVPLNEPVFAMVKLSVVSPPVKVTKLTNDSAPLLLLKVPSFKPSVVALFWSRTWSINQVLLTPFCPTRTLSIPLPIIPAKPK